MKKINIFNLKTICALFVLSMTMMISFFLVGCGEKEYTASINQEEYVLSVGETKDISKDITFENITLQDLSFHSSDESIVEVFSSKPLDSKNVAQLNAIKPGKAIVYIYLRGETLDSVNVVVKDQFASPTNIQVSSTGLITWDAVVGIVDSQIIKPTYEVFIAVDVDSYESFWATSKKYYVDTNAFQLTDPGRYFVCVSAVGTKYIDKSEDSDFIEVYYQSVRAVSNLTFTNVNDGHSERGVLSWDSVDGADYYKLNIDSREIEITSTSYTLDLTEYQAGQTAIISVTACSNDANLMDSPIEKIKVVKLGISGVSVNNGLIQWNKNENAVRYLLNYKSVTDPTIQGSISLTQNSTYLDELEPGAYTISIQAVGTIDDYEETYYANSKPTNILGNVAKLENPEFDYQIEGNKVLFKLSTENSGLKDFEVKFVEIATKREIVKSLSITSPANGGVFSTEITEVELQEVGKYDVIVKSIGSNLSNYNVGGNVCESALDSRAERKLEVYKLPTVGTINHSYNASGSSVLSFTRPAYEMNYSKILGYIVEINGREIEISEKTFAGGYNLNIGEISKDLELEGSPNQYSISITTKLDDLPERVEFIGGTSTKEMTRLNVATLNLQENELVNHYTYSSQNANGYKYTLYATNSDFAERGEIKAEARDSYGRMTKPNAGYYILDIIAYSNNPNRYLNGTATDKFYVTKNLLQPVIKFGKDVPVNTELLSGYYVEIDAVDQATNYDVYLNGNLKENVIDADQDGKIYYYFTKDYDFGTGASYIKVVSKGYDDFLFHKNEHQISVEKLSIPSAPTQENQTLKFTYSDGILNFYKNVVSPENILTKVVDGENYIIDFSEYASDFKIIVYATKDNVENANYYIPSDQVEYNTHKIVSIKDLYFSGDSVYFTYQDTTDILLLTEGRKNDKIEVTAYVTLQGESSREVVFDLEIQELIKNIDGNRFSFKLIDLIDNLSASNQDFVSLYTQRDSIKLEMQINASFYDGSSSTFVFSSQKATSRDDIEKTFISIEKIKKPQIFFDESSKVAYWNDEQDAFSYEIRINGTETLQSPVYVNSRYEFDLSKYFDEADPFTIEMRKSADNFLDSDWSNKISMNFLKKVSSMNVVTNQDGESFANFTYVESGIDASKISINVNNSEDIEVTSGQDFTSYQFKLQPAVTNYTINIVGYNETDANGDLIYYVGSSSLSFTLESLPPIVEESEFTIENKKISWQAYSRVDTPKYQINFYLNGNPSAKVVVDTTSLSLSHETLLLLAAGNYQVDVFAVNRDFSINAGEKAYYGGTVISNGRLVKLDQVQNLVADFDESKETILDETSNTVALSWSWNGEHNDSSNIKFNVYLNDTLRTTINYVSGINDYSYTVDVGQISEFNNTFKIIVESDKDIIATTSNKALYRFSAPTISVDDEKKLSISYSTGMANIVASKGYIVSVYFQGTKVDEFVTLDSEVDLTNSFNGHSGNYEVEVIIKGVKDVAIWSVRSATFTGTALTKPTIVRTSGGVKIDTTDTDVEYYIKVLKDEEEIVSETKLGSSIYNFTDNLTNGSYTVIAYTRKDGKATSEIATLEITVDRIGVVQNPSIQRVRSYTSSGFTTQYNLSWLRVEDATSYIVTFYDKNGNEKLNLTTSINSLSVTDLMLFANITTGGQYFIGVRACGNIEKGQTDGFETRYEIEIQDPITEVSLTNDGQLTFIGNGNYYLYATDGTKNIKVVLNQANAQKVTDGEYRYTYFINNVSGLVKLGINKIGSMSDYQLNTTYFVLDSKLFTSSFNKLDVVSSVYLNPNTGLIEITTSKIYEEDTKFFFEYVDKNGDTNKYNCTITDKTDNIYTINFAVIFDALGIDKEGEISIDLYITQNDTLRSEKTQFVIYYTASAEGDYTTARGQDVLHDYLMINADNNKYVKQIYLKKNETQYFIFTAAEYRGYWNVFDSHGSLTATIDNTAISSREVYALLVNELEQTSEHQTFTYRIAYVYSTDSIDFVFNGWSQMIEYKKLPKTNNPTSDNGKINWTINSGVSLSADITGFYVEFVDLNGNSTKVYVSTAENCELDASMIPNSSEVYKVYVTSVNNETTHVIASNKTVLRDSSGNEQYLIKTDSLEKATKIQSGVLSIDLLRDGTDESYGELSGEELAVGTSIAKEDMPYGFGRYYEVSLPRLMMQEGTGTFTAINIEGQVKYIRTKFITRDGSEGNYTYSINSTAKVYTNYNVALEDYVEDYNTKFPSRTRNFVEVMSKVTFTYPFVYTLADFENTNFVLNFKNNQTNEISAIEVNATNIVKKPSGTKGTAIVNAISEVVENIDSGYTGFAEFTALATLLKDATSLTGLANYNLLFDNIAKGLNGLTGEQIQAGIYTLSIYQKGKKELVVYNFATQKNMKIAVLNSQPVVINEEVEVASSPSTKTYRELNEDGYTYSYYLKFSPTTSNGELISQYKLSLEYVPQNGEDKAYLNYNISRVKVGEDYEWRFALTGSNYFVMNTMTEGNETYVLLPLNGENGINALIKSKSYVYIANIYAVGNSSRLNSKTEQIQIEFLGFNSISLSTKGFEWLTYTNEGKRYATQVVYQISGETQARLHTVSAADTPRSFLPQGEGLYDYIMFMTPGDIDTYSVSVESEIYRIENVYKLYQPEVQVGEEGIFYIQNSENNPADYVPIYKITNNQSVLYNAQNPQENELSYISSDTTYRPGTNATNPDKYKQTELTATSYNFVVQGNNLSQFTIVKQNGYNIMTGFTGNLYLTSSSNQVRAIMLENPDQLQVNASGDIEWSKVTKSNQGNYSAQFDDGETTIIYKVVVEYWYYTLAPDGQSEILTKDGDYSNVYYTKNNYLPASYVEGANEDNEYVYVITVSAFAGKDGEALNTVLTNITPYTLTNVQYVSESQEYFVLTGSGKEADFTRLNDVRNIAITDGKITWESDYKDLNTYEYKVYFEGASTTGFIPGTYVYDMTTGKFIFTMDSANELLSSSETYKISVFVSATDPTLNMMTSFESSISNIKIIPSVEADQVVSSNMVVEDEDTKRTYSVDTYDLRAYFDKYISEPYSKEIAVTFTLYNSADVQSGSGTLKLYYYSEESKQTSFEVVNTTGTFDANAYKIYLPNGYSMILEIVAITDSENYLNSYVYSIPLVKKTWGDLDTISFDQESQQFTWTYGKFKEYYISTETSYHGNSSLNNPRGNLAVGSVLNILNEGTTYYQIWIDNDTDKVVDTNERFYIGKSVVSIREAYKEPNETVYYNVYIKYFEEVIGSETRTEMQTTKIYNNVTDNFFIPEIVGATVVEFKVQVREGIKNVYSDWLEFDCPATDSSEAIVFSLFADGVGSEDDPYLISNSEQFENMKYYDDKPNYLTYYTQITKQIVYDRASGNLLTEYSPVTTMISGEGDKYYFEITNELTIESNGNVIVESFKSILNGNGHTITFISTGASDISTSSYRYSTGNDGSYKEVSFDKANSIFKTIDQDAVISDIVLNISYAYNPQTGETANTLFAGLALINYGKIEHVTVNEFNIDATTTINPTLAVAGIVGINSGTISNAIFNAKTSITNTNSTEQTMLFGGIAGFNLGSSAVIEFSKFSSSATANLRFEKSNGGIAQVGGIAISNHFGQILLCGNEGQISAVSLNGTGYASGISVYSNEGAILDCFNTGNINGAQIAGIVYSCSSAIGNIVSVGSLQRSFDIATNHIANMFAGNLRSTCYTRQSVSQTVQTAALNSSITLTTSKANVNMEVTVSGSTYTVKFVVV